MSKAILVIDMPEECCDCTFHYMTYDENVYYVDKCLALNNETIDGYTDKYDGCPLKEAPVKIDAPGYDNSIKAKNKNAEEVGMYMYDRGIYTGYNLCIDKILGEK